MLLERAFVGRADAPHDALQNRAFATASLTDSGLPQQVNEPTDIIPGGSSSNFTLAIGGSETGVVNTAGDDDWFRVELVSGQSYVFTMTGSGVSPLDDTYLELRSLNGILLARDDDAGPGTDAVLKFTATTSGTYFINARAWEPEGASPPGYAGTGGYQISAAIGAPQNPLNAIDYNFTVPTNVSVYFSLGGQTWGSGAGAITALRDWTLDEIAAAMNALARYAAVTNLSFTQTFNSSEATFKLVLADLDPGVLGQFAVTAGVGAFDPAGTGWTSAGLQPGGAGFATLLHEFGHGLGLAHPHDNGGVAPGSEIMQGVVSEFSSYGTFDLNQGVFTTMSYNAGHPRGSGAPSSTAGSQATPGTLDIALLQQRYGANANTNAGDTLYTIGLTNGAYAAIWDTGGNDTIQYSGSNAVRIDLRPATLLNAFGGGGYVSYASPVRAGYVIAAGVVVENAIGGAGNDTLTGNNANNFIAGNDGDDSIDGGAGADSMAGGAGNDTYEVDNVSDSITEQGGGGADLVRSNASSFVLPQNVESMQMLGAAVQGVGNAQDNVIFGQDSNNVIYGLDGADRLYAAGGADYLYGGSGADQLAGNDGNDALYGEGGDDSLEGGAEADYIDGGDGDDFLRGDDGNDVLIGGAGNDVMLGMLGNDALYGGDGNDEFNTGEGSNYVEAGQGNDIVFGGPGVDVVYGSAGNDTLHGGEGDDSLYGAFGAYTLNGGDGVDLLQVDGSVGVTISGGAGSDYLIVATAGGVSLSATDIENWFGFSGADAFNATGASTLIYMRGSDGNDALTGGLLGDYLYGDAGDDVLVGGAGDDTLIGGVGVDALNGGDGVDVLYVDSTDTDYQGGAGADYLIVQDTGAGTYNVGARNVEFAYGFTGADTISALGLVAAAELHGGDGSDTLTGGAGVNTLLGEAGADALVAGGAATDHFVGGAGADIVYVLSNGGVDYFYDYQDGVDKIDVHGAGIGVFAGLSIDNSYAASNWYGVDYGTGTLWVNTGGIGALDASDFVY